MQQLSVNELLERLAWAKQQVAQLEGECERWRNQALLAEAKVRTLQDANHELSQKIAHSLPLYDPDEYIPDRG